MAHVATAATRRLPRLEGIPHHPTSSAPSHRRAALKSLHCCHLLLLIRDGDAVSLQISGFRLVVHQVCACHGAAKGQLTRVLGHACALWALVV